MAKKEQVKPEFRMSFASLEQLGDKGIGLAGRDSAELAEFGIDATWTGNLESKVDDLKDMPTDDELRAEISLKTEEKDALRDVLEADIRTIVVRAKNVFGEKSAKYRRFGFSAMDELNDAEMVRLGRRVKRSAQRFLTELAVRGLTQQEIDDMNTNLGDFDDKIDEKDEAVRDRDIATEDRIELGNEIYGLITELFDYGKDIWRETNEAKYNDYVIYRRDNTPPPPIEREGGTTAGQTSMLAGEEDNITDTTDVELTNTSTTAASLTFCRTDTPSSCPVTALTLAPGDSVTRQASELGASGGFIMATNHSAEDGTWRIVIL